MRVLDIPNAQPTPTLSQSSLGATRFFLSSLVAAMLVELWADQESSNVRDGGDDDMGNALGDEELEKSAGGDRERQ